MSVQFVSSCILLINLIWWSNFNGVSTASKFCQALDTTSAMFIINKVIYLKISNGKFMTYNPANNNQQFVDAHKLTGNDNSFSDISMACHFDPYESCSRTVSNIDYCRYSSVFNNLVMITGMVNSEKTMSLFTIEKNSHLSPYLVKEHTASSKSAIFPDVSSRLHAAMWQLFRQIKGNRHLKFTAMAYNEHLDKLFVSVTVMDDSVANSAEWGLGKYALFALNFSQIGMMQEPDYLHSFTTPISGLIDYNGDVFALSGQKVFLLNEDGKEIHTYDLKSFFGCSNSKSPLSQKATPPTISRLNMDDNFAQLNYLSFPWFGPDIRVVESSMLTGMTFVAIVASLTILLILIVAIDGVIIYKMSKSKSEDAASQRVSRGSSSSGGRSSLSNRSQQRSRSKSGGSRKSQKTQTN